MGKYILENNVEIPDFCFGTDITYIHSYGFKRFYQETKCKLKILLKKDEQISRKNISLPKMIELSMNNGCNMFDTSRAYGSSEFTLGNTLRKYPRQDYFVVTKLSNEDQFNQNIRGGLEKSLAELGLSYVDLYLMHWPVNGYFVDSWKEMEQLYYEGKCRAIGVCNFNIHHLEELKKNSVGIMPMVNEFECHPLFTQDLLRKYCHDNKIQVMAYTATARMDERLKKTCLVPISKKYKKTIAQVILRWHQQIGNIPIVNSTNPKHLLSNICINDFEMTNEEIEMITNININSRLRYDPDNCDFHQL